MQSKNKLPVLIGLAIIGILMLVVTLTAVKFAKVSGNEIGVRETWSGGVDENPLFPGTHFLFPGWTNSVYNYDLSSQVFVMNDIKGDVAVGRDYDAYHVQSLEGQDMAISLNVRWRLDPEKIIHLHKTVRADFEEKLIRPVVMRVVKDEATTRKAIDAYSGEGLVQLQAAIQKDLCDPAGELRHRGIIVENFVIEGIRLDENYIGEIRARQVASQRKLRADEETKAAEAQALKAKADAQSDYNKKVVEAERDAKVAVTEAKQKAESQVIAAESAAKKVELDAQAEAKKVLVAAEAEKQSGEMRASAIKAIGEAKALATKLEVEAYGADNYTKLKVAESLAQANSGIRGYLPANMSVNVLSENFFKSLEGLLGGNQQKK